MFSHAALQRIVWLAVVSGLFALSVHLFFGSIIAASADDLARQIVARDIYKDGAHHFSGMVMVPSQCHELVVRAQDLDANTVVIVFETWEQPYRTCTQDSVPRAFAIVAFAPRDVEVKALLDGKVVPFRMIDTEQEMAIDLTM